MNQILGFLTAFFVVAWGLRWYFRQGSTPPLIEWKPPKRDTVMPPVTRWETLTDVTVEATLDDTPVIEGSAPRKLEYEPADDVERRLEALVSAGDEPEIDPREAADVPDTESGEVDAQSETPTQAEAEPTGEKSESEYPPVQDVIIGFCARCRDKREVLNPVRTQTKKGKAAIRGSCSVCGAGMFVFVSEPS